MNYKRICIYLVCVNLLAASALCGLFAGKQICKKECPAQEVAIDTTVAIECKKEIDKLIRENGKLKHQIKEDDILIESLDRNLKKALEKL